MRPYASAFGLLAICLACGEDAPAEPETAGACPIDAPLRLAAAPAGFTAAPNTWYGLYRFGDDLLFTFDRLDDPERAYFHLNRCTGKLAAYPALAPGLHNPYTIAAAGGRVVYANDGVGRKYIVDRLDEPGDDQPVPVPGLPEETASYFVFAPSIDLPYATFRADEAHEDPTGFGAAGIGGRRYTLFAHAGDRDVAALKLHESVVQHWQIDADELLLLDDEGELQRVDPRTGASDTLLTGARHVEFLWDTRVVLWQELGDDETETVYRRDLDSGDEVAIGVNEFAALSWERDPAGRHLGDWSITGDAAALPGPDERFVAAARLDTGAPLAIPEHQRPRGTSDHEFILELEQGGQQVLILWHPLTGETREWYRGAALGPRIYRRDGDRIDYILPAPEAASNSLWTVDLASGERSQLLPHFGTASRLDEHRYLLQYEDGSLPGPPLDGGVYFGVTARDFKLVDTRTGLYIPIAAEIPAFTIIPDEGLLYLDSLGPDPGVWVYPF